MALDLHALLDPAHTALVTQECQEGVIGKGSVLPGLAEAVGKVNMVENAARLARAARAAGVPVIHCTAERRADGLGANHNARLFQAMAKAKQPLLPGSPAARLVPQLGPEPGDLVLARLHGVSPFQGPELDPVLRNLGVRTIVGVGVSVNVAIQNFAFDAVNAAYQMVIPRDAVAGFPAEYVEMVFANTLGAIATLTSTDDVLRVWGR